MAGASPLILVVDDQLGVRRLIQEVFREAGYRVATAAHGQEALAVAAVEEPSVVLLDMKMPVMDGLDTLKALKGLYPNIAVLMMTAVDDRERVSEAFRSGAVACIEKPFDVFALRQQVEQLIREEHEV